MNKPRMLESPGGQNSKSLPTPAPQDRACLHLAILQDDVTFGGRYTVPLHPWGGGRDFAGTLELREGRGEQGLNPQAPVQVCLCPRRAAIRVHFGVLIMEPLQHFLTNQSQAHQEGLVVKVAPFLSKRVLWGKGDKRDGRCKSEWIALAKAALGPCEMCAQLLSHRDRGGRT